MQAKCSAIDLSWLLIFRTAIAISALVSEETGDHVVLRAVEAPVVDKLADHKRHDGPEATNIRNQVEYCVAAPRVDLQIQVTLKRDLKLGSIFFLLTLIGLFFESKYVVLLFHGQVCKVEKVILEDQLGLGDHKRLDDRHERVDS